mmetsp:Transcript_6373/g.13027  ORF Transcript_6373/g.13027 Transcript_6373/m.13027 type:complete len:219 (-) Transcript_6373:188-844(-)
MLQHAHLVQDTAQRPNVALVPVWLRLANLRGHVVGCAHHCGSHIHRALQHSRDAKITYLHVVASFARPLGCEEDVRALEVAVQNMALVHVVQCQRELQEPCHDLSLGDVIDGLRLCAPLHLATKISGVTILHDDDQLEAGLSHEVVDKGHYVRMSQIAHELHLLKGQVVLLLGQELEPDYLGDRLVARARTAPATYTASGGRSPTPLHEVGGAILSAA